MASTFEDRVDSVSASAAVKVPCRVATTANITLSGEQTIDGVAVVSGDRVLVKDQTTTTENGIYVAATSAWSRAVDFDGFRDVVQGTLVAVANGTANADTFWRVTSANPITLGTTSITFGVSNSSLGGVSPFMETVLDDTTAAAARTTLGAGTMDDLVDDTTPQLGGALDTNSKAVNYSEGSAVASATSPDIWATDGNTVHITGTTTITDFANAPRVGASRWLVFDGALTLTHGSGITLPGSANITTAAGDMAYVYADAVDAFRVVYFKASGAATVDSDVPGPVLATQQASTSGTSIDFTSIPSGTKRITIMFNGVSTNGTSNILVQLGDSGGVETTGYVSSVSYSATDANTTAGLVVVAGNGAANVWNGAVTLNLMNSATFTWASSSVIAAAGAATRIQGGVKSLSAELDRVRITMANGTDTFDAGAINISYEG